MTRRTFSVLWRLAILALPWQTRWFADASLAGWPWEQGRWSFYVSWFLIAATIVLGVVMRRREARGNSRPTEFSLSGKTCRVVCSSLVVLFVATVVACGTDLVAWKTAAQWWLQVGLLAAFIWTLVRADIPRRTLAAWTVLALLPHVALGFWQYAIQKVVGHPWLGIATQLPQDAGVSVIEHGEYRVLRMYGGFPHPNIFGGWAAVGLILSLWLAATSATKTRCLAWSAATSALAVALLLSYARGAWIAAAVGIVTLVVSLFRKGYTIATVGGITYPSRQYLAVAFMTACLVVLPIAATQSDHLAVRFGGTERLEAKSLETRVSSLRAAEFIFYRNFLFGTGPNAELLDLAATVDGDGSGSPLEPPHCAYVLAFVDFGILGSIALTYVLFLFVRAVFRRGGIATPLFASLAILALFDHYPWSLWSGQSLVAVVVALILARDSVRDDSIAPKAIYTIQPTV